MSYILPEAISLSGIMSVLFCAITMDHYTSWNLTPQLVPVADSLFEMLSDVAEGEEERKRN